MVNINKVLILLVFISFLFSLIEGGIFPFVIFYSLLLTFLIGSAYIYIQGKLINVDVIFKEIVQTAGNTAECLTIVKCDSIFPVPYVSIESDIYKNSRGNYNGGLMNITLKENAWIRIKIDFNQRGIYNFGAVKVCIMDLLRLFKYKKNIDCSIKVKVYPKIYHIDRLYFGGKDIYQETIDYQSRNEDMFSINEVRKYRDGDNLKKIHWKVSAKHGELYVRNSDTISGEEFILFVDMSKENFKLDESGIIEEQVVDLCASIVSYMQINCIQIRVFMNTLHPVSININTLEKFNYFMEFLINQKSDGEMSFARFINENVIRAQRMNAIAVITAEVNAIIAESMLAAKNSGYNMAVFYCRENAAGLDNLNLLRRSGVFCCSLDDVKNMA